MYVVVTFNPLIYFVKKNIQKSVFLHIVGYVCKKITSYHTLSLYKISNKKKVFKCHEYQLKSFVRNVKSD